MAYNKLKIGGDKKNVGQKYTAKEDLARVIKLILTPKDFSFATQADAEDDTKWQDAIEQVADRIYPMPYAYENEDLSEEATKQDFPGGDSLEVRKGRYAERQKFSLSVADMVKLASFNNQTYRAFEIDANGNINGTSPNGTIFQGFEVTNLDIEKMNRTIGDVTRLVPMYFKYREPSEWTDKGVALRPLHLDTVADQWDPRDLDGLTDVELTIVSSIATKIVVKAEAALKSVLLKGFNQTADWLVKDASGVAQVVTVTDNNDGTYDLDGTGFATNFTVDLNTPPNLTLDGYESLGPKTLTV
jgi:hypothetical protein